MKVEGSTSPDGKNYFQMVSASEDRSISMLSLVLAANGQQVGDSLPMGYGFYPHTADPEVLKILWAPDSKTVAIMTRGTKRTRTLDLYTVNEGGLVAIQLSTDITQAALKELGGTEYERFIIEEPIKWLDPDQIIVRARGDLHLAGEYGQYEAEVTCSVSQRTVISAKKISWGPIEN